MIKAELDNILTSIKEQHKEEVVVVNRKELLEKLIKVTNVPKKELWNYILCPFGIAPRRDPKSVGPPARLDGQRLDLALWARDIKDYTGWTNSRSEIDEGSFKYKIEY